MGLYTSLSPEKIKVFSAVTCLAHVTLLAGGSHWLALPDRESPTFLVKDQSYHTSYEEQKAKEVKLNVFWIIPGFSSNLHSTLIYSETKVTSIQSGDLCLVHDALQEILEVSTFTMVKAILASLLTDIPESVKRFELKYVHTKLKNTN